MSNSHEDSDILRLRGCGDEGLAQAFRTHYARLERIVGLRLDPRLRGRVDAGDILQEAFLNARRRLARYLEDPGVPVFIWLRGVALDTLIDNHRRNFAKMRDAALEVPLHAGRRPQLSSISLAGSLVADLTTPSQAAIRDELAARVVNVLDAMDEIDREILVMRHVEQLSNNEVASAVGVKAAAASRRYIRALKRFREVVENIPGFGSEE